MNTSPHFPPEGLEFLRRLKRNNRRPWFQKHRDEYETYVRAPMVEFVLALRQDLARFAPEIIADPALSLYRIYRDTRFSKDKKPYKTHAAAVFPRQGLPKHAGAGFYFHIGAEEVWMGGGIYMPGREELLGIREYLAERHAAYRAIIESPAFRRRFGAVEGEKLSRVPIGFRSDHPAAEYLKYKQWYAGCQYEPEFACSPRFYRTLLDCFRTLLLFVRFLNEPLVKSTPRLAAAWLASGRLPVAAPTPSRPQ